MAEPTPPDASAPPRPAVGADAPRRIAFRVTGTVQGVGFRPFVRTAADELGLTGWVGNDPTGAGGEAEGDPAAVEHFLGRLTAGPPLPARVAAVLVEDLPPTGSSGFEVRASTVAGERSSAVPPDVALCADCRADLDDERGRHHGDAFVSCTRCGPRWSILTGLPWDRERTTLAAFPRCPACDAAYRSPGDRRFRAEASTCPACGPTLTLLPPPAAGATPLRAGAALDGAVAVLDDGGIVAVKGVGGFHLAVRAGDPAAVERLRRRKGRDDKPFAVLVADLATARELAHVDDAEAALLASPAAPIVLCERRAEGSVPPALRVVPAVAPGRRELGLLVAYTPLHLLLIRAVGGVPLLLTSANVTDEPIVHRDDELDRLWPVADAVLTYDRPIATPVEDSVARVVAGAPQLLRRARGFVPDPLPLPHDPPGTVLALGADLKSTVALTHRGAVVLSSHLGDLHHAAALDALEREVDRLLELLDVTPSLIAHDLHPDYASTRLARRLADRAGVPTLAVQHHHAHVAAVLAEHGRSGPLLGVAYDGTGHGDDGTVWGGELLLAGLGGFRRVGHLAPVPLPGGGAAARQPWRMAVAHLLAAGRATPPTPPAGTAPGVTAEQWQAVAALCRTGTNAPATTSAGRLFDAAAHLVIGRTTTTYEGQAAIELEQLVPAGADPTDRYGLEGEISGDRRTDATGDAVPLVLPAPALVARVADDVAAGVDPAVVAARFHHELAALTVHALTRLRAGTGVATVALCGGVLQNRVLAETLDASLRAEGFEVLLPRAVPPNDGAIAYGQAAVAAARLADG